MLVAIFILSKFAFSEVEYSESGDGLTLFITGSGNAERKGVLKGSYKLYQKIEIADSITSLGDEIFMDCVEVTQVKMPSYLSYLGVSAFKSCYKLTSIEIPEGVTALLANTFYDNKLLKTVKIPSTVTQIDAGSTFYNCISIDTYDISLGNKYLKTNDEKDMILTFDGLTAIKSRGYGEIVVPSSVQHLDSLFAAHFPAVTSISFPDSSLLTVKGYAFYSTAITDIVFPDGLLKILEETFYRSNVVSVYLPSSVIEISTAAFYDCSSLRTVNFASGCAISKVGDVLFTVDNKNILFIPPTTDTLTVGKDVTSILSTHLTQTTNLLHVNVDENNQIYSSSVDVLYKIVDTNKYHTLYAIPRLLKTVEVHRDCKTLGVKAMIATQVETIIFLGDEVTRLESECVSSCPMLKNFTFPTKVSYIGPYSFFGLKHSSSYVFYDTLIEIHRFCFANSGGIKGADFSRCTHLTTFYQNMFHNCYSLEYIKLPPNLNEIPAELFYECHSLKSVEIPSSCSGVLSKAFSGCQSLSTITFAPTSNVKVLAVDSFVSCAMETITLPDNLLTIESGVFRNCKNLKNLIISEGSNLDSILSDVFDGCDSLEEVSLPSKLKTISPGAFSICPNLKNIFISDSNTNLKAIDGVVFDYSHTLLICPNGRYVYQIPEDVISIRHKAFYGCLHLYDLSFDVSKVESIGENTLSGCTNLTAISLPSSLKVLEIGAFSGCSLLSSVEFALDCSLTVLKEGTFTGCPKLARIQFPSGLLEIADSVFEGCPIENLNLPESLTKIGANSFKNNQVIKTLLIPTSTASIGQSAFLGCASLERVTYCGTAEISTNAFSGVKANCVYVSLGYSYQTLGGLPALPILDRDCMVKTEVFTLNSGISSIVINMTLLDFSLPSEN